MCWLVRDKKKMSVYLSLYSKCTKQKYEDVTKKVELFIDIYKYLYNANNLYIDLDYTVEECNKLRKLENYGGYHIYEFRLASEEMSEHAKEMLYNNMRKKYYDTIN